ncbi:IS66 family insertion sequence element accessory protein TnpB [Ruminiclostridium sufflavum]|uniref:IS66 family insertion sequence element accessory protein TnpB n=1 Tax=Ruminiclostridium sufflavum TaxID=396504 RepID=UPI003BF48EBB
MSTLLWEQLTFADRSAVLVSLIQPQLGIYPFIESGIFIFCNKKRDSIKILRYNKI